MPRSTAPWLGVVRISRRGCGLRRLTAVAVFLAGGVTGCSGGSALSTGSGTVHVLYAGSLVNLMEQRIGPAFTKATGDRYQGYGAASQAVANTISGRVQTGDVFISASPSVNDSLTGSSHGDWVRWYATFATAPLVLGYSTSSRFAADLRSTPWYDVLRAPGIRVGMTDPDLDPKGALTLAALDAAAKAYHLPTGYAASVQTRAQVFPEQDLLGRLESGQLDVGFFYTNEAVPAHLHTVPLGQVHEAATFTVTVLERAPDPVGGAAFVRYLLTAARPALRAGGLQTLTPTLHGPVAAVPAVLRSLLH